MDTSNNLELIADQQLALSYIFGLQNRRITSAMLDPETWVQVAYHVLSLCSESLPYFHSMVEAREVIRKLCGTMGRLKVHYAQGVLTETTRVYIICNLSSEKEKLRYVSRKLLLTADANLVELIEEKKAYVSEVHGDEGRVIWDSHSVNFRLVGNERLIELMALNDDLIKLLCLSINKVLTQAITRRERQLSSLRSAHNALGRAAQIL